MNLIWMWEHKGHIWWEGGERSGPIISQLLQEAAKEFIWRGENKAKRRKRLRKEKAVISLTAAFLASALLTFRAR